MSTQTRPTTMRLDATAYAESLHAYAASRLDAFSLRCWIIQRLMLDNGLDHDAAERTCEQVLASAAPITHVRPEGASR